MYSFLYVLYRLLYVLYERQRERQRQRYRETDGEKLFVNTVEAHGATIQHVFNDLFMIVLVRCGTIWDIASHLIGQGQA